MMAAKNPYTTLAQDESLLSDDGVDESLWESGAKHASTAKREGVGNFNKTAQNSKSSYEEQVARDLILRQELESVRKVNEAIEGVIESLDKAKGSMKASVHVRISRMLLTKWQTVNQTVNATSTLLHTWTRILSQTEHNQRLILDPSWEGVSQDIADMERELVAKQQAAERREAEEQERRTAAARKAEEDERRRAEATTKSTKPTGRGKGRVGGRGSNTTTSAGTGYVAVGGSANTSTSGILRGPSTARRGATGIGRGAGLRGRGRGS
jgi:DASH complex subunit Duo1